MAWGRPNKHTQQKTITIKKIFLVDFIFPSFKAEVNGLSQLTRNRRLDFLRSFPSFLKIRKNKFFD